MGSKGNTYAMLRSLVTAKAVLLVLFVFATACAVETQTITPISSVKVQGTANAVEVHQTTSETIVADLINEARTDRFKDPLIANKKLDRAALKHAKYLDADNLVSHLDKNSETVFARVEATGYDGCFLERKCWESPI